MKKISIIFILFLCISISFEAKSQSFVGLRGGINIPSVNYTNFVRGPIVTGFRNEFFIAPSFGVSYRNMQSEKIGVQIDLNYSTKGWGQLTLLETNTFITRINYLELPFYLHWQLIGKKKLKFFVDAGVYVAWALSAEQEIANDVDLVENQIIYSVEKDNRGDFGIYAGAGVSYDFSIFILQLDGNFKSGFANILPVNPFIKENPPISTNQVPSVQLSVLFPISKD
ncbi:Outer membrane protein beta-barrel domain-containing protein [Marivirga sericea]|uniref:Outer membrane protein beta-barrel domain-containing protein n=1 Tax=Marivirga sericea TaxID=1028 RepID=A0A1X7L9S9_9BACT|nr:porin family protein [Marivirga sericea]SMG50244.1 Outer membrane protein beta-barrel domain-containing protein [Marivirga sericea]